MKQLITVTCAVLFCIPSMSQSIMRSTLGSSGSAQVVFTEKNFYFVSQSVGQASVIGTFTNQHYTIRQGFQQPPHSFDIGLPFSGSDLAAIIYPNPFEQSVHISFTEVIKQPIKVILYDVSGRLLLIESYESSQLITLPLAHLATGGYILNVNAGNKRLTTSLIKQ